MTGEIPTSTARSSRRSSSSGSATRCARAYDARAALPARLRRGRRAPRRPDARWPTWPASRSPPRPTCARTTRSACSPCRASRSPGCTPAAVRRASRPWSATPPADLDTWSELMARSIRAAGGRPGDLVHVAYGYGLFTGGLGAHYGAERLGCTVVPVSGGMTERQVQLIVDFEPRVIMVTPSYFLAILDEMEAQGVDPRDTSLEVGIFGAEPWTDEMRRAVEARTGLRAVDIYGLVGGDGAGREPGVGGDPGRPARLGGPLPARDRRPGHPGACCPTARRASWSSPASPSRRCRWSATAPAT